jgi:hypothetical protein
MTERRNAMLQKFVSDIIVSVLKDEDVQQFIKDLLSGVITEKVLPLLPIAIGAAVKGVVDKIEGIEMVGDAIDVANDVRNTLNNIIPDFDTGIKTIDDLMDIWRPKA